MEAQEGNSRDSSPGAPRELGDPSGIEEVGVRSAQRRSNKKKGCEEGEEDGSKKIVRTTVDSHRSGEWMRIGEECCSERERRGRERGDGSSPIDP